MIREAKPKPTISDTGHKQVGVYARVSTKSTNQVSSIENQTKYYTKKLRIHQTGLCMRYIVMRESQAHLLNIEQNLKE